MCAAPLVLFSQGPRRAFLLPSFSARLRRFCQPPRRRAQASRKDGGLSLSVPAPKVPENL